MSSPIRAIAPLSFPWTTADPFLFCAYHKDDYPRGNAELGPDAALAGRQLGMDFANVDGWNMYHGERVPGFPAHPHRGFETVTIVRRGFVDHSDSLGACARFGPGDVQWMTAGAGIVHAEMFPLLRREQDNPLELFQLWLNLPRARKLVAPHFKMIWSEQIARREADGATLTVIAGACEELVGIAPPPESWAVDPQNDVAIWLVDLEPAASLRLPPARQAAMRSLYLYRGQVELGSKRVAAPSVISLDPRSSLELKGIASSALLMLQGQPIGEPVAQRGPFVMNSADEIIQAMVDYRQTGFGGWPWSSAAPVHPADETRFARHADGCGERP